VTRTLYEALSDPSAAEDPWAAEGLEVAPLLRALARAGARARAAQELADEEYDQGFWVAEEEPPAELPARLAAMDRADEATYAAGPWRVRLSASGDDWTATQEAGPNGATLVLGAAGGDRYVALQPGLPAPIPAQAPRPDALVLLEPSGRRSRLPRRVTEG
jgi:hypothetical protein